MSIVIWRMIHTAASLLLLPSRFIFVMNTPQRKQPQAFIELISPVARGAVLEFAQDHKVHLRSMRSQCAHNIGNPLS